MSRRTQITPGTRFDRLVTLGETFSKKVGKQPYAHVKCRCDCGEEVVKLVKHLLNGKVKSCGCLRREIAGQRSAERARRRKEAEDGDGTSHAASPVR